MNAITLGRFKALYNELNKIKAREEKLFDEINGHFLERDIEMSITFVKGDGYVILDHETALITPINDWLITDLLKCTNNGEAKDSLEKHGGGVA